MQKLMRAMHKNEKGFTLVELMVVVVIIGILVAIAIPIYGLVTTNAANRSHDANVRTLHGAANMYMAEHGTGISVTDLNLDAYIDDWPMAVPPDSDARNDEATHNYQVDISSGIVSVDPSYID